MGGRAKGKEKEKEGRFRRHLSSSELMKFAARGLDFDENQNPQMPD